MKDTAHQVKVWGRVMKHLRTAMRTAGDAAPRGLAVPVSPERKHVAGATRTPVPQTPRKRGSHSRNGIFRSQTETKLRDTNR